MPMLHGETKVFIDFEGMLYDTDTYVVRELYNIVDKQRDQHTPFDELKNIYEVISEENLKYYLQFKSFENPLFMFSTIYEEDDDFDLEEFLDTTYQNILYTYKAPSEQEELSGDVVNKLSISGIGQGLRHLIHDENFTELFIYSKQPLNDDIIQRIALDLDLSDNITFLTGDKKKCMVENMADYYFITNLSDLYYIATKCYDYEINFLVPAFSFNMNDDEELPMLNLEENAIITKRKYNIEVCYTTIPIL